MNDNAKLGGNGVMKITPKDIKINDDGSVSFANDEINEFVKKEFAGTDSHIILMGSDCG